MRYQRRTIDLDLDELFDELPAIALDGARGVGKTSTATERTIAQIRLDTASVRQLIAADPESLLSRSRPLLIDEWQRAPEVWDVVRRSIDEDYRGGQFFLTGSAAPAPGAASHSGAGRIARMHMRPMTLEERGFEAPTVSMRRLVDGASPIHGHTERRLVDYLDETIRSGFPAIRPLGDRARRVQLDSYLRNIVDRDIPDLGASVRKPDLMLDWLRAYAAATASTTSYTEILDAATPGVTEKPARTTTATYRDLLAQLWLLDPVPAWGPIGNAFARLQQVPKHHLVDPALAVRLLGLSAEALLDGGGTPIGPQQGTMIGRLFESLVTLSVRVAAQAAESSIGHLRTRNGDHEVDLVIIRPDGRIIAIEVKLSATVNDRDVRHLRWIQSHLGAQVIDRMVINTGPAAYRRPDGIAVVPLALLGP